VGYLLFGDSARGCPDIRTISEPSWIFNPDGARALLAQAGFAPGSRVSEIERLPIPAARSISAPRSTFSVARWREVLDLDLRLAACRMRRTQQRYVTDDELTSRWAADIRRSRPPAPVLPVT